MLSRSVCILSNCRNVLLDIQIALDAFRALCIEGKMKVYPQCINSYNQLSKCKLFPSLLLFHTKPSAMSIFCLLGGCLPMFSILYYKMSLTHLKTLYGTHTGLDTRGTLICQMEFQIIYIPFLGNMV